MKIEILLSAYDKRMQLPQLPQIMVSQDKITKRIYLPNEIVLHIVDEVSDVVTLLAMMQTCKRFRFIVLSSFGAIDTILNAFWENIDAIKITSHKLRIIDVCHIYSKKCIMITCVPYFTIEDFEITIVTPTFIFGKISKKLLLAQDLHQIEKKGVYICISAIGIGERKREIITVTMFF